MAAANGGKRTVPGRLQFAGCTVMAASTEVPFHEAVITAATTLWTWPPVTTKRADPLPCGMVTLGGTVATPGLLLVSVTTAPPAGASPFRKTVADAFPPETMVDGLIINWTRIGGTTVNCAAKVAPEAPDRVAETVAVVLAVTWEVFAVNVALETPAGMATLGGTATTAGLLLDSVMFTPPAGAALLNCSVPDAVRPLATVMGLRTNEERLGAPGVRRQTLPRLLVMSVPASQPLSASAKCSPLNWGVVPLGVCSAVQVLPPSVVRDTNPPVPPIQAMLGLIACTA